MARHTDPEGPDPVGMCKWCGATVYEGGEYVDEGGRVDDDLHAECAERFYCWRAEERREPEWRS